MNWLDYRKQVEAGMSPKGLAHLLLAEYKINHKNYKEKVNDLGISYLPEDKEIKWLLGAHVHVGGACIFTKEKDDYFNSIIAIGLIFYGPYGIPNVHLSVSKYSKEEYAIKAYKFAEDVTMPLERLKSYVFDPLSIDEGSKRNFVANEFGVTPDQILIRIMENQSCFF